MVVLWEIGCRAWNVPIYLFPKPSDVALKLASDWGTLLGALGITLRIALQAFAAAIIIGTLIAFLFVQSRAIEMSFFPYAVLLQVTPIVAIAPLIIILVKNTQVALTVCATVVALFPIIANTTLGLRSVDPGLVEPVPHEQGGPAADPACDFAFRARSPTSSGVEDFERSRAHRGGRGRVRRRHRRPQLGPRLRNPPVRFPARHPAHVRGACF